MSKIHVVPCSPIPVRNMETGELFPPEGAEVEHTEYIDRRIREGVLEPTTPGGEDPGDGGLDLASMKVPELKKLAAEAGVEGADGMKKAQLVAALEALEDDGEGEGEED